MGRSVCARGPAIHHDHCRRFEACHGDGDDDLKQEARRASGVVVSCPWWRKGVRARGGELPRAVPGVLHDPPQLCVPAVARRPQQRPDVRRRAYTLARNELDGMIDLVGDEW